MKVSMVKRIDGQRETERDGWRDDGKMDREMDG